MSDQQAAKRIPKSLGTETKLLGRYTLSDAAVALLPGVAIVLFTQMVLPDSVSLWGYSPQRLTLPIAAAGIVFGALFVSLTPPYTSSLTWLFTMLDYRRQPSQEDHETAPEHTRIERVHPNHDAIERQDGAVIGFLQVAPPPMALATQEEWDTKAEAFQNFLNTTVTFPIQLYSTTESFPVEAYLDRYRDRLSDPDVEANPRLATLIEEYIDWYEQDLRARQMTIRDHYVVVTVRPAEIQFGSESLFDRLCEVPLLGTIITAWRGPPVEEQRAAMFETLDDRLDRVERGIREIDGCQSHRIDAATAAAVIGEYWTGESVDAGRMNQRLRTCPIVGGEA